MNDSYQSSPTGNWWLIDNHRDCNQDGLINSGDWFNFDMNSQRSYTILPDPAILRITSQHGTWYYVTGTSDEWGLLNFAIYRTRDFSTFEPHMLAFDWWNQLGSGQQTVLIDLPPVGPGPEDRKVLRLNNGKQFHGLWAPQLYRDPTLTPALVLDGPGDGGGGDGGGDDGGGDDSDDDASDAQASGYWPPVPDDVVNEVEMDDEAFDEWVAGSGQTDNGLDPWIFLTFSAIENKDPLPASDRYRSCFHVRMRQSKFLEWHTVANPFQNPPNPPTAARRFADIRSGQGWQAWYAYLLNNSTQLPYIYDGGRAQWIAEGGSGPGLPSRRIPAAGSGALAGLNCGQLDDSPGLQALRHRCGYGYTWMNIDPFMYVDPSLPNTDLWKRAMMFNWGESGNHISAHPARPHQFLYHALNINTVALASKRNTNNPIRGPQCQNFDNGASNGIGVEVPNWGVAEGVAAFYKPGPVPGTGRHYLIYSRNGFNSLAYQLVYRMTAPGQRLDSLAIPFSNVSSVQEHVLLRADRYEVGPCGPGAPGGASFGHGEVFSIKDTQDALHYYLIFHAKLAGANAQFIDRTVFIKELTFDPVNGHILQLAENSPDPCRDIHKFRIPVCRKYGP